MNIVGWLVCIIGGIFGIGLVGGTALGMIGVVIWKIYRKCQYNNGWWKSTVCTDCGWKSQACN